MSMQNTLYAEKACGLLTITLIYLSHTVATKLEAHSCIGIFTQLSMYALALQFPSVELRGLKMFQDANDLCAKQGP